MHPSASWAEKIDRGYVGRILQLTLLAPDIVEAILDGRQPPDLNLPKLMKPFPMEWERQRTAWNREPRNMVDERLRSKRDRRR